MRDKDRRIKDFLSHSNDWNTKGGKPFIGFSNQQVHEFHN